MSSERPHASSSPPLLILCTPASRDTGSRAGAESLCHKLESFGTVSSTIDAGAITADALHALCVRHAGIVIILTDALVEWLSALGRAADIGARGFSLDSFDAWLCRDSASGQPSRRLRLFPVRLRYDQPSAATQLVRGKHTLFLDGSDEALEGLLQVCSMPCS